MKKGTVLFSILFVFSIVAGQVDKNGNPVFNNINLSEDDLGYFELSCNYYTINSNISNKESSVYLSDTPSSAEYLRFARDLPSYFFIVHRSSTVFALILLVQNNEETKTSLQYNILNPNTGKTMDVPCHVWGDISEKRAEELIELNVDSAADLIDLPLNGKGLLFDGIAYRIQPYDKLKEEVKELARYVMKPEENVDSLEEYIKSETVGGRLDFNKILEQKQEVLFIYDEIAYNKNAYAILLWGQAINKLGIESSAKATKLWEEIHDTKLSASEKKALKKGFESNL